MLTHMNPTMLAKVSEAKSAGVLVAEDGMALDCERQMNEPIGVAWFSALNPLQSAARFESEFHWG